MKKLIIVVMVFISFFSCELNLDDSSEYYQFQEADYMFIPTIYNDIGKVIMFRNQQSDEISIEVAAYTANKISNGGWNWSGGSSTSLYYTEQLLIGFELLDVNFPSIGDGYCDQLHISINKRADQTLETNITIPSYTSFCSSSKLKISSPFDDLSEMAIGNANYNRVKTFTTENNYLFINESTINTVYYDLKMGLIGFDDTENNIQYRIVND